MLEKIRIKLDELKEKIEQFIINPQKKDVIYTTVSICKVHLKLKNGEEITYLTNNYYRDYNNFVKKNKEFKTNTRTYLLSDVFSYNIIRLKDSRVDIPFDGITNKYEPAVVHPYIKNSAVLD